MRGRVEERRSGEKYKRFGDRNELCPPIATKSLPDYRALSRFVVVAEFILVGKDRSIELDHAAGELAAAALTSVILARASVPQSVDRFERQGRGVGFRIIWPEELLAGDPASDHYLDLRGRAWLCGCCSAR
jgi:hypothetical protein